MCFPRRRRLQVAEDIERGSARPTHGSPQSVSVHAARSERSPSWSLFKLTPYRLMSLALVLSLGIWKAVASYRNQALLSSTLDTLLTLCLPAIMFLIGLAADTCPPWLRWFYHQDLIVSLLQLLNYGAHPDIDAPADPLQMGHDPQDTDTASTVSSLRNYCCNERVTCVEMLCSATKSRCPQRHHVLSLSPSIQQRLKRRTTRSELIRAAIISCNVDRSKEEEYPSCSPPW
ncbi:hypothetical protein BDW22DRAFT_1358127 [Trametopsis cervina]|nr:hypothetical protein BDW22DRAFT_1358127 [Trametopsis cervina]